MSAKPIVVIYLPNEFTLGGSGRLMSAIDLMDTLNSGYGRVHHDTRYTDYWKDYYWFCFYKDQIQEPEFKVFYEKDFTEVQFAELKKLVEDSIVNFKK